jgi:hypothetical protein
MGGLFASIIIYCTLLETIHMIVSHCDECLCLPKNSINIH